MRKRSFPRSLALSFASLLVASSAIAAEPLRELPPAPPAAGPPGGAPAPAAEEEDKDGARFRGGVSAAFGGLIGSEGPLDYSGVLGGVNGNLGVQINDLIGIYAIPHLAFGSITASATVANTTVEVSEGWLAVAVTAMVDFTFIDQIFVGAGGGATAHAATCTNCDGLTGGVLQFRFGGYPLMGFGDDGIRRQGLMVGADMRINFLSSNGQSITLIQPMATIGYEAF
ncbi:MAG: hypothetical protein JRI68_29270 [Deltaproteobacteria bacterium]|nr:hypothetical protein [Deltaproteobacteria bacterium]